MDLRGERERKRLDRGNSNSSMYVCALVWLHLRKGALCARRVSSKRDGCGGGGKITQTGRALTQVHHRAHKVLHCACANFFISLKRTLSEDAAHPKQMNRNRFYSMVKWRTWSLSSAKKKMADFNLRQQPAFFNKVIYWNRIATIPKRW